MILLLHKLRTYLRQQTVVECSSCVDDVKPKGVKTYMKNGECKQIWIHVEMLTLRIY